MREVQIFDQDRPGYLIPLARLLQAIERTDSEGLRGRWRLFPGAYAGYGEDLVALEESLDEHGTSFAGEALFPLLLGGTQYFYDARMAKADGSLELGIFDTTYLFLRGPDELVSQIARMFDHVEFVGSIESASEDTADV